MKTPMRKESRVGSTTAARLRSDGLRKDSEEARLAVPLSAALTTVVVT